MAFCDEIVVVDSGSADATREIARAAGARVVEQDWLGFGAQRNVAIDHATGDWVLEVDADERVTPALCAEIQAFLAAPPPGVEIAGLPLRERFLGRFLGPAGKYPKYRRRLFRRGAYRHPEGRTVHEGLLPTGPVHPFEGDLEHLLADSWREAVHDAWAYARLEAGQMSAPATPRAVARGAVLRPVAKLGYRLVLDGGWRDGVPGAIKIGLDCGMDATVWARHAAGRRGEVTGASGVPANLHYGSRRIRQGVPRSVAIALGGPAARAAAAWLSERAASGEDVVLVSDVAAAPDGVRRRELTGSGPVALIRALDAEDQLRAYDRIVPFGPRARALARLVPPGLRGVGPS